MKAQVDTVETTVRTVAEAEDGARLRGLSQALQGVHRSLIEMTRDRYELVGRTVPNQGALLGLLLSDPAFAWLRPLSGLIVQIDELAAREPVPSPVETAAMGAHVRAFTSLSEDRDAFGSRYCEVLATEPRVAMSHLNLRDALVALPEPEAGAPDGLQSAPEGDGTMQEQLDTKEREAAFVEDAATISMMGFRVLEALPSRSAPYAQLDPFILLHESNIRPSEMRDVDTRHPHRGFDNLWYVLNGSVSTGHSTGPGGATERAQLTAGGLLKLRTGRGAWHAESIGADERDQGLDDTAARTVLFWVNLARKDKQVEPTAQVLQAEEVTVRQEGDATVRVLVGEGSPIQLGTPALILDVQLPDGGGATFPVPPEFQGFAYMLDGEAAFGANRRRATPPQLVLLGPGREFTVADAAPGTRFLLMAGEPYGEAPIFNGPYVD